MSKSGGKIKRHLTILLCLAALTGALPVNAAVHAAADTPRTEKTHMRIHFKTEGGLASIPALSQPKTVDSSELTKQELKELQKRIAEAKFFELPGNLRPPPSGAADFQEYTVTIEEEGRRHTVQFTDLTDNPALKNLFAYLKSLRQGRE